MGPHAGFSGRCRIAQWPFGLFGQRLLPRRRDRTRRRTEGGPGSWTGIVGALALVAGERSFEVEGEILICFIGCVLLRPSQVMRIRSRPYQPHFISPVATLGRCRG